jgi:(p)ppGpp synthase/HD superfamily hydrolase
LTVPILTARFESALAFAARLHIDQVRNMTRIPYVSHLLGTASLALEHGADEDQAIAALLHDAVEDQGGTPTLQTIERLFGARVAAIVRACSDNPGDGEDIPWKERKVAYLKHLRDTDADARLVSASDKLHNARAILSDLRREGDSVWKRFTPSPSEIAWYYRSLVDVFKDARGPASLAFELEPVVREIEALAGAATVAE